jgi:hypothetical protein
MVASMASSKTESLTLWAIAWEIASFILGLGVRRLGNVRMVTTRKNIERTHKIEDCKERGKGRG